MSTIYLSGPHEPCHLHYDRDHHAAGPYPVQENPMEHPIAGFPAETPRLEIAGTWLVEHVNSCTCSGVSPHEPGCGQDPIADLTTLPGWTDLVQSIQRGLIQ